MLDWSALAPRSAPARSRRGDGSGLLRRRRPRLTPPELAGRIHPCCSSRSQGADPAGPIGLRGQEALRVPPSLIRDAAYEALSKESRADLHARFADWLEDVGRDRLAEYAEIVGWHLEQAHRYLSELGPPGERGSARSACRRPPGGGGLDGLRPWGRIRRSNAAVAGARPDAGGRRAPPAAPRRSRRRAPLERALRRGRTRSRRGDREPPSGPATSKPASARGSGRCGSASRSIRTPTTRHWRPKGWKRRRSAGERRRLARLGRGASSTGRVGASASSKGCGRLRSAPTSTTAAPRTSTTRRTTSSASWPPWSSA